MSEAILGLGSNLGRPIENLQNAIDSIGLLPKTEIIKLSSFYETEPCEVPDIQENYINCCIRINTKLSPHALVGAGLGIEAAMGRQRPYKFAPRIIDIDLLVYDDLIITTDDLILPHPRIRQRNFVIIPMSEVCSDCYFNGFDFSKDYASTNFHGLKKL